MDVYQLKIALRGISPMVWRRLKIAGNTDLGDLHTIIQLAMGWKDYHLHTFRIYAKDYGTYKPGGMLFEDDPKKVFLSDFRFRVGDRFEYAYDFTAGWVVWCKKWNEHFQACPLQIFSDRTVTLV